MPYLSQQLSRRNVAAALALALVAACDSGPSDSEFITACLAEGERGANKMMRREMGVKGEDILQVRRQGSPITPVAAGPASHDSRHAGQEGGSAAQSEKR